MSRIVFAIAAIILALSILPSFYRALQSPPDRTYLFLHNNPHDYYSYLAMMERGYAGDWLLTNPYSPEPENPALFHILYVYLGKLAHLGLTLPILYHVTRLVSAVLLLVGVYKLFMAVFPKNLLAQGAGFLLYLTASPLFTLEKTMTGWKIHPFMIIAWTGVDPLFRHAFLPHHMVGNVLLIFMIICFFSFLKKPNIRDLAGIGLMGFLAALIHPPSTIIFDLITVPALLIYPLMNRLSKRSIVQTIIIGLTLIPHGLSLLLMASQEGLGFPWDAYRLAELNLQFSRFPELALGLGILLPFSFFSIIVILKKPRFPQLFLYLWLTIPLLLVGLGPRFGFWSMRFIQGNSYVPLAILAMITIESFHSQRLKRVTLIAIIALSIPVFLFSADSLWLQSPRLYVNTHPKKEVFEAGAFLANSVSHDSIVLSNFDMGSLLPALAPVKVVTGNRILTKNGDEKISDINRLFYTKLPAQEAKAILAKYHVNYVFTGEWEIDWQTNPYPQFLSPVFAKDPVRIYKVKSN